MAKHIIGIDEAGRGPVIGPLVVCGVMIQEQDEQKLLQMGVKDSKQLTRKRREFLFEPIKAAVEKYRVVIYPPAEIDEMMGRGVNLNAIEAKAMIEIISLLEGDIAYIDCPSVNTKNYAASLLAKLSRHCDIVAEHKADETYPVVSAASIIAKVIRDTEIEKLRQRYGDFGSGYPSDPKTKLFLQKNVDAYPALFRHYWEPCEKAAEDKIQTRLQNFSSDH